MKVSNSTNEALRPMSPNGPACSIVAQIAKPVRIKPTVAVSRGPRRSAAQTSGRIVRKPSGLVYWVRGSSGLKAIRPTPMANISAAATAPSSWRLKERQPESAHSTMTGVTTSAPAASPSHQVTQISVNFAQSAKPATLSVTTPMVALVMVAGPTATRANFATRARRREGLAAARPAFDQKSADDAFQSVAERQ